MQLLLKPNLKLVIEIEGLYLKREVNYKRATHITLVVKICDGDISIIQDV